MAMVEPERQGASDEGAGNLKDLARVISGESNPDPWSQGGPVLGHGDADEQWEDGRLGKG